MPDVDTAPSVTRNANGSLRWTRVDAGEYRCGPWRADREYYADGDTLFDWVLTSSVDPVWWSFPRLLDIRVFVQTLEDALTDHPSARRLFFELVGDDPGPPPRVDQLCTLVDVALNSPR